MHDILRQRIVRKLEAIPDEKVYQVLDYIEFLESEYADEPAARPSGIRRFAERFEDRMRGNSVRPGAIRGAVSLLSTADRLLSGVTRTGRRIVDDLTSPGRPGTRTGSSGGSSRGSTGDARRESRTGPRREPSAGGDGPDAGPPEDAAGGEAGSG